MRTWIGYLGPLLAAAGAWLATPQPHPLVGASIVLGALAAAALVGLVGVHLGSQLTVGVALVLGLAVTFPPDVPMSWLGPIAILAGAVLALEGAAARESGLPMAPLPAWGLPVGLLVAAALVPLVALTTRVGRESLDLTQGLGLAVTAPFLLGAAFAVLEVLNTDEEPESGGTEDTSTPASPDAGRAPVAWLTLAALLVLVVGGFAAGVAQADHVDACALERGHGGDSIDFFFCGVRWEAVAMDGGGEVVTGEAVELGPSRALLIQTPWQNGAERNLTMRWAEISMGMQGDAANPNCPNQEVTLFRALQPWTNDTAYEDRPEGEDPVTFSPTPDQCSAPISINFNVTDQARAWTNGSTSAGWILEQTNVAGNFTRGSGIPGLTGAYSTNPPEIGANETSPATGDDGVLMAPVDGRVHVNATIHDPKGDVRDATLSVDDQVVAEAPLSPDANLSFEANEGTEGALVLNVTDWDGNTVSRQLASVQPDEAPPSLEPGPQAPIEAGESTWEVTEVQPEGASAKVQVDLDDDACAFLDVCVNLTVRNVTGDAIQSFEGNGSVNVTLPTDSPGTHALDLTVTDRADRTTQRALFYNVSEPRDPTVAVERVEDPLGREGRQEAGLAVEVTTDVDDESPPITLNVTANGRELTNRTVASVDEPVLLRPVVETVGRTTLTVNVEDRWGNTGQATASVEVLPQQPPRIELPNATHVNSGHSMDAFVEDASVGPENVTVTVLREGQPLPSADVASELVDDGVELEVQLPELLHGETVTLVVSATDPLGQFTSEQSSHRADVEGPTVDVEPTDGAVGADAVWTRPDGDLDVEASDRGSGVLSLTVQEPFRRELDPGGDRVPVGDLTSGRSVNLTVEARDAVGNTGNWTGALAVDDSPPEVELGVDGHHVVARIDESGSGVLAVELTSNGTSLDVPQVAGEHRVEVPGVRAGDEIDVNLTAEDRVGLTGNVAETLVVEEAPPDLRLSSREGRSMQLFAEDPDGFDVRVSAVAEHAVNATRVELDPAGDGTITLPDWHGDVHVTARAEAGNLTSEETRTELLGEPPYLTPSIPAGAEPGQEVEIPVTWTRDYRSIQFVLETEAGDQVATANVTETGPGEGTATFEAPDGEGTYRLSVSALHEDGSVTTASAGEIEVSSPPAAWAWIVAGLLALALVGTVLLYWYREEDEDEPGSSPRA